MKLKMGMNEEMDLQQGGVTRYVELEFHRHDLYMSTNFIGMVGSTDSLSIG